jgi:hypothetical protein
VTLSSSNTVAWPWASEIVAPSGLVRLRKNVSVGSPVTSSSVATVTILDVSPGAKVSTVGANAV